MDVLAVVACVLVAGHLVRQAPPVKTYKTMIDRTISMQQTEPAAGATAWEGVGWNKDRVVKLKVYGA